MPCVEEGFITGQFGREEGFYFIEEEVAGAVAGEAVGTRVAEGGDEDETADGVSPWEGVSSCH